MRTKVLVRGVEKTIAEGVRVSERYRKAFIQGSILESERIMTKSQEMVPVLTGRLKNSKFVTHNITRDGVKTEMGYRADYAIFVHEMPPSRAKHENGSWQFLRLPIMYAAPGADERIADFILKSMWG